MTLPIIKPMLAAPSTATGSRRAIDLSTLVGGSHLFDLKLDGLRALVYWDGSTARIINRSGIDITRKFPDIEAVLPALGTIPVILDGEIVCDSGLFNDVATRGKQEKPHAIADAVTRLPARFIAFDILHLDGTDLLTTPYFDRRMMLDGLVVLLKDTAITASMMSTDGMTMWQAVTSLGLEGLIAKRKDGVYMQGKRSPLWLKFKTTRRITCIATGYEPGTGARAHFGAMYLALVGPAGAVPVGKVGTGFTETEIQALKADLDAGTMPLVEIEALNVGSGGQLRFPVYKGYRTDLSHADAKLDQLDTLPRC
jgi:bifunctional non-homologous end joining protein LigD